MKVPLISQFLRSLLFIALLVYTVVFLKTVKVDYELRELQTAEFYFYGSSNNQSDFVFKYTNCSYLQYFNKSNYFSWRCSINFSATQFVSGVDWNIPQINNFHVWPMAFSFKEENIDNYWPAFPPSLYTLAENSRLSAHISAQSFNGNLHYTASIVLEGTYCEFFAPYSDCNLPPSCPQWSCGTLTQQIFFRNDLETRTFVLYEYDLKNLIYIAVLLALTAVDLIYMLWDCSPAKPDELQNSQNLDIDDKLINESIDGNSANEETNLLKT